MTVASASVGAADVRREILALKAVVAVFLALRIWFQLYGGLLGDEAYYWMWGQHPGWSYYDHPPLHAWLLSFVSIFGWSVFSVRILTWASLALVFAVLWSWSRRLAPESSDLWFWRAAATYLATPVFFVLTSGAYNDHLLVALCLASVHAFVLFVERSEAHLPHTRRWLFAAAFLLGLATLTKYNAIFVGVGFAATFLLRPKLRVLLLTPAPWLAAILSVAMQAPVLWWNLTEHGASFRYHLADRWGDAPGELNWFNALRFLVLSLIFWSPFLVWPLIRLLRTQAPDGFASIARTVALAIFTASTSILLVTSVLLDAYFYWNIVALVSLTPLLVAHTNRWLRVGHYLYGLLWAAALMVNFTIVPLATLMGQRDLGTALNYDWHIVAERMAAASASHPDALVGATRYSTTSQLGFALGRSDVVKLSPEHSQWDYWQADRSFAGASALILSDESDRSAALRYLRAHFDTVTVVDAFDIERLDRPIYSWRILLGENWRD